MRFSSSDIQWLSVALALSACSPPHSSAPSTPSPCAPDSLQQTSSSTGSAKVFVPDPMLAAHNRNLSPTSSTLDNFATPVTLQRLSGYGVLVGQYVDVRNVLACNTWYGAYDATQQFSYSHKDFRFQEAMAYYNGDLYRSYIDSIGYQMTSAPVVILAHCKLEDNAFFVRTTDQNGQLLEYVCLGDSVGTPGADYGDDSAVTVHELEHSTTVDNYSPTNELNQFFFDEAGSLNEAISDFMGLMFEAPLMTAAGYDPRVFSEWALGTFIPAHSGVRGAHRCPTYDPTYPNCTGFPNFSANTNTVSYVYPDGVGWPYANNFSGPGYASSAFQSYPAQEEIHNSGILMQGTLYDIYSALEANHEGSASTAQTLATQLAIEGVRHLDQPSLSGNLSPVTYVGYANALVSSAELLKMSSQDLNSITHVLTARGLYQAPTLTQSSWAAIGAGSLAAPGLFVLDDPTKLGVWFRALGADGSVITQTAATGLNGRLDPGEVADVWFDLQNTSELTAGGVLLTISSPSPDLTFLGPTVNAGYVGPNQVQIRYGKVNGTAIVNALSSGNPTYHVPTGNTYFKTNPFMGRPDPNYGPSMYTGVMVQIAAHAPHQEVINLSVTAQPANGVSSTVNFPVRIN